MTENNGKVFALSKEKSMKINILILFIFSISLSTLAQTPEKIKRNPDYVWGESTSSTLELADQFAMKDLISQISIKVESSFSNVMTESASDIKEFTRSAISTYSNIYLNNAQRIVINKKKSIYVLRYIERQDIDEMFLNRKTKIYDYVNLAIRAEQDLRIADALRYYYWALILSTSHPEANNLKYTTCDKMEISLLPFIQSELDKIFQTLRVSITDTINVANTKSFVLSVQYKSKPVTNLDYVYWYGDGFSNLYSAKDGRGIIDFFSRQADNFSDIKLKIEYVYESRSIIDQEVQSVLQMTVLPRLKEAEITIPINNVQKKVIHEQELLLRDSIIENSYSEVDIMSKINIANISKMLIEINNAIVAKDVNSVNDLFTENGLECYNKLIKYGNAKVLPNDKEIRYISVNNQTMIRSIPMSFTFPNNNRSFIEDVVFIIDSTGKVDNINFALNENSTQDIMNKGERFGTEEEKYFLINFLECYKTAYSLENIEYIESIFSEDALIIVGTVLKPSEPIDNMYNLLNGQNIKYEKYSKDEYVEYLKKAFESKEFVNIQFEENEIRKSGSDEKIYGIQIAQNYYSSNYSDKGYLFLMVDLEDSINPKIYVRTWQPEKNADGTTIGLEHFSIR